MKALAALAMTLSSGTVFGVLMMDWPLARACGLSMCVLLVEAMALAPEDEDGR